MGVKSENLPQKLIQNQINSNEFEKERPSLSMSHLISIENSESDALNQPLSRLVRGL